MSTSADWAGFTRRGSRCYASGAIRSMGLWKDKQRKHWCYKFERGSRAYTGRGFRTKAAALAAREEHKKKLSRQLIRPSTEFRYAAAAYLNEARARFVAKTYKQKVFVVKEFLRVLGNRPCNQYTAHEITIYLLGRPTNNNFNAHRKDLSSVFSYIKNNLKLIEENPVSQVARLPHAPAQKYVPTIEDVLKLLQVASERQRAFLLAVLYTGARVDEIQRLTWQDVDFVQMTVTRYTRKRKGGSLAPITTKITGGLERVLKWCHAHRGCDSELVFPNPKTGRKYNRRFKMIKSLCRKAGLARTFTFHALRHCVASTLAGPCQVDRKSIGDMLGHKSLGTTEIYLRGLTGGAAAASQALEGVFDLAAAAGGGFGPKKPLAAGPGGKRKPEKLGK